ARALRDVKIELVRSAFGDFLDDVRPLVVLGRDPVPAGLLPGVRRVRGRVAGAGPPVAGVDGHLVPAGGEPLLPGDAILAVGDVGPVAGLLAVQGGELDDAVVQRLALEEDLARHLLAAPRVATPAERAEGDHAQDEPEGGCESAHGRLLLDRAAG